MNSISLISELSHDPMAVIEFFAAVFTATYMFHLGVRQGIQNTKKSSRLRMKALRNSHQDQIRYFHRLLFSDLADRGALFPKRSRENRLRLYGVGTYWSTKKQSLKKSSAHRIRLPEA